jgi:hypothetical protein
MDIGDKKTIDGSTYRLLAQGETKAKATRSANWQRRGGDSARIEKVARGNYRVWVGPALPRYR